MASNEALKDLDITNEELNRLQKALKDDKFRKMFVEYAEEISNPENRKRYEEEIAELERNRGMDVKFINPEPAFVLKTYVDGEKKAFVNCCKNVNIGKPQSKLTEQNGQSGYQWTIPHSLSPSRLDTDKEGNKCTVFDCVFHPECFLIAEKDLRFKKMIEDTALDGIEREFKVKVDRNNIKQLKNMKYKGRMSTTVIRTANTQGPTTKVDGVSTFNLPYPYESDSTDVNSNETMRENSSSLGKEAAQCKGMLQNGEKGTNNTNSDGPTIPHYTVTHRGFLDMQQFVNAPDSKPSTRPQELVIKISLPLLKSACGIQLDVFEKRLYLESTNPGNYKLDISLPFPIDENHGSAKFDKSKSCMVVTLPVQPPDVPALPSFAPSIDNKSLVEERNAESGDGENNHEKEISPSLNAEVASQSQSCNVITGIKRQENFLNNSSGEGEQNVTVIGLKVPQEEDQYDLQNVNADCLEKHPAPLNESFILPDFSFHQRDESISIIVKVHSVSPTTVKSQLSKNGRDCWINFWSPKSDKEEGAFYGLQLVFPEGSKMSSVTCDVSSSNVVFVLHKEEGFAEELQSFQAGPSTGNLQRKTFATQHSIQESIDDLTIEKQGKGLQQAEMKLVKIIRSDDGPSHSHLNVTLEVNKEEDTLKEATATDAGLSIDICSSSNFSETASSSSPDITPLSPNSLLKSSLRGQRKRSSKSVSFSDEVVVGTFVSFQSRKDRKKSPHIRKSKQKLKAPSQETCSDSELILYKGGDDSEEDLWNIVPLRRTLHRQSSSESETDGLGSPKGNHKKSKGSRRRRKEKARRALMMEGSSGESKTEEEEEEVFTNGPSEETIAKHKNSEDVVSSSDSAEVSTGGDGDKSQKSAKQETNDNERKEDEDNAEDDKDGEWTTVTKKRHHKIEVDNVEQATIDHKQDRDEDVVDLDKLDHHTKSAVEFSNKVMFDLDD